MKENLFAPCGLYCGVCGVYVASRNKNQNLKEKLAVAYNTTPDQIKCRGCLSNEKFGFCQVCEIRSCAANKEIDGCHCCDKFPCTLIENFPVPEGKKTILRSVPERKEWGDQKWAETEELRYTCSHCENKLFRGAKYCKVCNNSL